MDLDRIRNVAHIYQNLEGEDREESRRDAEFARGKLAESFPALSESDRAAISWFVAEILGSLCKVPLQKAGKVVNDSAAAYGVATVELLGWDK